MPNFERVLLKRDWRTPLGRFRRSEFGIPAEIPKRVLRRYALPSDAQIVGADYVPPQERDTEDETVELTSAQIEKEVQRRLDARMANDARKRERNRNVRTRHQAEAAAKAAEEADVEDGEDEVTQADTDDILDKLDSMSEQDLARLRAALGGDDPATEEEDDFEEDEDDDDLEDDEDDDAVQTETEAEAEAEAEEEEDDDLLSILDQSVRKVAASLEGLSEEDLLRLKKAEEDGNTRKGVIASIDAALEDLADEAEYEDD